MSHKIADTLFGQYIKEYYNGEIIETDCGFIIYYIKDNICMVDDLYVVPEKRRSKGADELAKMVESVARESKCHYLEAEAFTDAVTFEQSIGAMSYYGFVKITEDLDRRCELWRKQLDYV